MNQPAPDRIIGRRLFTDGAERPVYEDGDGRQYVVDDDGRRVEGVCVLPADEAAMVYPDWALRPLTERKRNRAQP
jgi:hypothetical protein